MRRYFREWRPKCRPSSPNSFFNKTSTTIKDISGYGNNGALTNGPVYNTTNGGNILFDGSDDYIILPNINFTTEMSVSVWVNITENGYESLIGNWQLQGNGDSWIMTSQNNGKMYFFTSNSTNTGYGVISDSGYTLNTWYNYVGVFDNGIQKIYRNGVEQVSSNVGFTSIYQNSNQLWIGHYSTYYLNGNIAQALLYNRALTSQEILQNYNVTKSRFESIDFSPTTFVSTWYISTPTTITLPLVSSGNYNFTVNWGDGSSDVITSHTATTKTHTYSTSGTKTIYINGTINGWSFNNTGDKSKITSVTQWGNLRLGNDGGYFYGCSNLKLTGVTDTLNLSGTTNLTHMFRSCSSLTTVNNINNWDVSKVLYMNYMFFITNFNQDLSNWNVSGVTDMSGLFSNASSFNNGGSANINNWDVGNVLYMDNMFANTYQFNQPLSGWNVSKVISMTGMFIGCIFNQPINNWNVSGVTSMSNMFRNGWSFNQPLSGWNVSGVYQMNDMFNGATNFNQDLGNWNVANVLSMTNMFANTSLSTNNYNSILTGWTGWIGGVPTKSVKSNVPFSVGSTKYTSGSTANDARNYLLTGKTWTITDGGGI